MFVCCSDKPMAKGCLNHLIDSFNLVQSASGLTQEHGHTLDLVLSYGLPVFNLEICDAVFSDHTPLTLPPPLILSLPLPLPLSAASSIVVGKEKVLTCGSLVLTS